MLTLDEFSKRHLWDLWARALWASYLILPLSLEYIFIFNTTVYVLVRETGETTACSWENKTEAKLLDTMGSIVIPTSRTYFYLCFFFFSFLFLLYRTCTGWIKYEWSIALLLKTTENHWKPLILSFGTAAASPAPAALAPIPADYTSVFPNLF